MNYKPNTDYVYESPDGGDTVYAREHGKTERILVGISYKKTKMEQELKDNELWHNIRELGKTNEALKNALEHCIILYHIAKDNGK